MTSSPSFSDIQPNNLPAFRAPQQTQAQAPVALMGKGMPSQVPFTTQPRPCQLRDGSELSSLDNGAVRIFEDLLVAWASGIPE